MNKISARIVADSLSPKGERLTTYVLTYPRFIHAEVMTHRVFSRNTASSRAIPFNKMLKLVQEDPFIPIAWQLDHKGMQGNEYADEILSDILTKQWLEARNEVVFMAKALNISNATKQLCNRLLEPFVWHTALVTATEWDNFFELRCSKYSLFSENIPLDFRSKKDLLKYVKAVEADEFKNQYDNLTDLDWIKLSQSGAEIHIQALAEAMWDAYNESVPKQLQPGEWHIPFGDQMDEKRLQQIAYGDCSVGDDVAYGLFDIELYKVKIAIARCARLSYMTFDGDIDYEKDIKLFDHLYQSKHMSPFEHVARAMNEEEYDSFIKGRITLGLDTSSGGWGGPPNVTYHPGENVRGWCNNIKGFVQYRYMLENGK